MYKLEYMRAPVFGTFGLSELDLVDVPLRVHDARVVVPVLVALLLMAYDNGICLYVCTVRTGVVPVEYRI